MPHETTHRSFTGQDLVQRIGITDHLGSDHADDQAHHPPHIPQKRTAGLPRSPAGLIILKGTVSPSPPGPARSSIASPGPNAPRPDDIQAGSGHVGA
jgi:hypothetical protein